MNWELAISGIILTLTGIIWMLGGIVPARHNQ